MNDPGTKQEWWNDRDNLALVASYIDDNAGASSEIIYMLEKPWKFTAEFIKAKTQQTSDRLDISGPEVG